MTEAPARTLWRISNFADLSGAGGRRFPGSWHAAGHPIVYLADSPSTALLETLVHLELTEDTYPDRRKLLEVAVPADCLIEELQLPEGEGWKQDLSLTRQLGMAWLRSLRSLRSPLASVPSVIVSEARSYLLNPMHPHAMRITVVSERVQSFDPRLFRFPPR
jgi:RES domain-containing protein